jgi:hypothetical protein
MVVLTGVLSLDGGGRTATPQADPPVVETPAPRVPDLVVARDASGRRQLLPFGGFAQQALVLELPAGCAGRRATVRLFRRRGEARDPRPWIEAHPTVRADGTVPMAGVVAGAYDVEVELQGVGTFAATSARSPGSVSVSKAAARPSAGAAPPR